MSNDKIEFPEYKIQIGTVDLIKRLTQRIHETSRLCGGWAVL